MVFKTTWRISEVIGSMEGLLDRFSGFLLSNWLYVYGMTKSVMMEEESL